PRRGAAAGAVDPHLPRQPAPHPRRPVRRRDPARRQRRERVDPPRRDRRLGGAFPRARRSPGGPMNRPLSWLALAVLVLGALELYGLHALLPLENRILDRYVRNQAAKMAPDPDIVLIDIDEKSLAAMQKEAGRWPW